MRDLKHLIFMEDLLQEANNDLVKQAKAEGHTVVMIGDGINDSPALSAADVGIAINSGAAIAREIADVTIKADSLEELVILKTIANSPAAPRQRQLPLCADLQLCPHRAGGNGHPAACVLCYAAQPLHHRHQPQEHDQSHPRGKGSEGSGRKELNPIRYKNTGCASNTAGIFMFRYYSRPICWAYSSSSSRSRKGVLTPSRSR